jgi:hypothetical protein
MFTLDGSLKGLDLRYTADPNAIVNQIFEQALNQSPEIFMPGMSAESLYFAPGPPTPRPSRWSLARKVWRLSFALRLLPRQRLTA